MFAGLVIPGMLDSDLMPPYDELVKLLLCKYELCKFADCDDEINGDVYKCDETDDEWPCDDDDGVTAVEGDCKSYFAGELMVDECMFESDGDVSEYDA